MQLGWIYLCDKLPLSTLLLSNIYKASKVIRVEGTKWSTRDARYDFPQFPLLYVAHCLLQNDLAIFWATFWPSDISNIRGQIFQKSAPPPFCTLQHSHRSFLSEIPKGPDISNIRPEPHRIIRSETSGMIYSFSFFPLILGDPDKPIIPSYDPTPHHTLD